MSRWRIVLRLKLLAVAGIVLLVAVGAWALGRASVEVPQPTAARAQPAAATPQRAAPAPQPDYERLKSRYGPTKYSQGIEEWIVRDYFGDRRGGVFVDVGANHYRDASNTFLLEERFNWSGIAIDPQGSYEADYLKHRPRTRFFPFFVSDRSNGTARLYMNDVPLVASADPNFTRHWGANLRSMDAPTITLNDLFDRLKLKRIDFLSIDVELSEPKVLAGLDIDRFRPAFVCIEAHSVVRQKILDYFAAHRYVVVGAYLRADANNLYFTPLK